jgi:hypothetical protein
MAYAVKEEATDPTVEMQPSSITAIATVTTPSSDATTAIATSSSDAFVTISTSSSFSSGATSINVSISPTVSSVDESSTLTLTTAKTAPKNEGFPPSDDTMRLSVAPATAAAVTTVTLTLNIYAAGSKNKASRGAPKFFHISSGLGKDAVPLLGFVVVCTLTSKKTWNMSNTVKDSSDCVQGTTPTCSFTIKALDKGNVRPGDGTKPIGIAGQTQPSICLRIFFPHISVQQGIISPLTVLSLGSAPGRDPRQYRIQIQSTSLVGDSGLNLTISHDNKYSLFPPFVFFFGQGEGG